MTDDELDPTAQADPDASFDDDGDALAARTTAPDDHKIPSAAVPDAEALTPDQGDVQGAPESED